jgi:hypothetical protein
MIARSIARDGMDFPIVQPSEHGRDVGPRNLNVDTIVSCGKFCKDTEVILDQEQSSTS